jgi:peptide/nickel transport system substrate-binding protein
VRTGSAAAAMAATAVLLAACGSGAATSSGSESAASAGTPVQGGTFTYDMEAPTLCADPEVSPQFADYQLSRPVVDSLVASSDGKTFKPWLATSWSVSPDAKHYTFTLKQGVTFSDGTPFNAEAVKYNLDRIHNPATKSQYAGVLLGPYASTTVLGPYKVEVNFSTGFNSFLAAASTANLGIQSPTALKKNAPCSPPVGSGPFVITHYNAQESATLTRRADYEWDPGTAKNKGPAYLSQVIMNFVTDDTTRVGSLTSGQVDSIEAPPANDVATLKKQGFQIIDHPQPGAVYNMYIDQSKAPWNNLNARLAFRDALDIPGMVEGIYDGVYQTAWSPIAASTPGYDPAVQNSWHQNIAQANQYLNELGYTKRDAAGFRVNAQGQELTATLISIDTREQRPELSLLIQQEEAKVGIDVKINSSETTGYQEEIDGGWGGMAASAEVNPSPDILSLLFDSTAIPTNGGINVGHVDSPQLDKWLTEAAGTLSTAQQDQLYGDVQKYVIQNAMIIPIYQEETLNAVTPKLHGLTYDATGYLLYYDAWLSH